MLNKIKLPESIRDAILIGLFIFVWQQNARTAAIETTLQLIVSGKINVAQYNK
jgi:hypothetical protein